MAGRPSAGPLGNAPRDLRDDFVGEAADLARGGKVPRWPTGPKRMVNPKNTFHAKVSGGTATKRADRDPHFRKGGWVNK
jgi:hypothetical protein